MNLARSSGETLTRRPTLMVRIWRVLTSSHAFVCPQFRIRARSLTLYRRSSRLTLSKVSILSLSLLFLLNITCLRINPAHSVIPNLSMG